MLFPSKRKQSNQRTETQTNWKPEWHKKADLNRCPLGGHFSPAPPGGELSVESPAGAAGPLVSLAPSCCGPRMALVLRGASHGCSCTLEILPAGSRHAAPLCRSGALSFRSAKPQRGSRPESIPSHGRSEVTGRGFPAFLAGFCWMEAVPPRRRAELGNFEGTAPWASLPLCVFMQKATSCCVLETRRACFPCKWFLLWEGRQAGWNSQSVSHFGGVFGEGKMLWTLGSSQAPAGLVQTRQVFSYVAVPPTAWIPLQLRYVKVDLWEPLPKCFLSPWSLFLPATDVGLYTPLLKVSENETERWNCNMLRLVRLNFGKAPVGKMDSTKAESIHALQSRCQALWMTT